jgi:uncharacterized protein YdaU (DUF1376 family)
MSTGNSLAMLPWFVRDYIAASRHLSLAERGAYTDLLFLSWEIGPLPSDPARLGRLVGCGAEEFAEVWPAIRGKFIETEAGLVNARLEEHRAESMQRSASARASAQARWSRYHGCERTADAMRTHSERSADGYANGHAKSMLPSPSPSPSPESGVLEDSDSRPRERTVAPTALHQEVIAAYHELLPHASRVKLWTPDRRRALDARIRERRKDGTPADTAAWWRKFFASVAAQPFLCGENDRGWTADFDWLLSPKGFRKVVEGRQYGDRRSEGAAHAR